MTCEKEEPGWRGVFLNAAETAPRGYSSALPCGPYSRDLFSQLTCSLANTAAARVEFGGFPCFDSKKFNESLVLKS